MDLSDVARYLKLVERGRDITPGAEAEAASARRIAAQMETEHPGLAATAKRVQAALAGNAQDDRFQRATGATGSTPFTAHPPKPPRPVAPAVSPWIQALGQRLEKAAVSAATGAATSAAATLTGAFNERFDPLRPGEYDVVTRECARGQVCVEVRARLDDVGDTDFRRDLLRDVAKELRGG